jgi:2-dehydropantoate 2-reductase
MLQNLGSDVGINSRAVVLQDLLKGRQTEIGFLNGLVAIKGREVNVPTPLNEAVTSLVKQIEQGKLKPDITNLETLKQYL